MQNKPNIAQNMVSKVNGLSVAKLHRFNFICSATYEMPFLLHITFYSHSSVQRKKKFKKYKRIFLMSDYENINRGCVVQPLPHVWWQHCYATGESLCFHQASLLPGEEASKHKGSREEGNRGCATLLPVAGDVMWLLVMPRPRKESASEKQNMSLCPACLAEHVLVCQITVNVLFPPPPSLLPKQSLVSPITGPVLFQQRQICQ